MHKILKFNNINQIGYSYVSDISHIFLNPGVWFIQNQLGYNVGINSSNYNSSNMMAYDDISYNFGQGISIPTKIPRISNAIPFLPFKDTSSSVKSP